MRTRTAASGQPRSAFTYHALAVMAGLTSGCSVVIPVVLWLTPAPALPDAVVVPGGTVVTSSALAPDDRPPVLLQGPAPAIRPSEQLVDPVLLAAALQLRDRLATARYLIASREILRARAILGEAALADEPEGLFLLAETFDPIHLAAMNVSEPRADADRARRLYERARDAGITAAQARLDQLR